MTEDDRFAGGDVVIAVFEFDRRRGAVGIELEYFLREPLSVGVIGDKVGDESTECDEESGHG